MKHGIQIAIVFFSLSLLISCEQKKITPKPKPTGGVVLTFDDAYVKEWFEADKVLNRYSWKATFCVCKINTLDTIEINKLHILENEGHEIAGHGFHHYNAVKFIEKYGIDNYMNQEIDPMLDVMQRDSFKVTSFAYPDGERTTKLDSALLGKFNIIRGRAFGDEKPNLQDCFYNNKRLVFGFDIDNNHINFSVPYLLKLLNYAKKNNKILILCSHKVVKNVTANYQTKLETLELVCDYMKKNNMKYYTLSDLNKLK